ncbi:unnamed protein product [Oncorhynchus mykiss]|uniref:Uncharacterized protein n=1 Tax=Oncorhynchus mykiss TaxID=8022 RepID=A0A060YUK9_ONCMY|nr:unnamed protein product [Oncorhynchus mykiss]
MNTRSTATLRTFEELPSKDPPGLDDEQGDSGMVLPSEELKRLKWTSGAKILTRSPPLTFNPSLITNECILCSVLIMIEGVCWQVLYHQYVQGEPGALHV